MLNNKDVYREMYLSKFKGEDFVKIGCAKHSETRCGRIGELEWMIVVKHNNARFLESMFHNALAEYRVPRFLIGSSDGGTEYFLIDCIDVFFDLCIKLNLEYCDYKNMLSYTKKKAKYGVFKANHNVITKAYLRGYRSAIFMHSDSPLDEIKYNKLEKKLEKSLYKQCIDHPKDVQI